jgi:hypothetical protein
VKYNSLKEALDDSTNTSGKTIVLNQDVSEAVTISKDVTINLNGYKITGVQDTEDKNTAGIKITSNVAVTLIGGTITSGAKIETVIENGGTGKLTLRNITIENGSDVTVPVSSKGSLTLQGTTKIPDAPNKVSNEEKALNLAIDLTAGAAATLKVDSVKVGETTLEPNVEVGNVKVVAGESKAVTLAIAQGKFGIITTTNLSTGDITGKEKETYITGELTGGTFGSDVTNYVKAQSAYAAQKTSDGKWEVVKDVVAVLGDGKTAQEFHKLSDAITAAGNSVATITLKKDTTDFVNITGGNITLNLGTYTLTTRASQDNDTGISVSSGAVLTINGGVITSQEHQDKIAANQETGTAEVPEVYGVATVIKNEGTLTLNNTTVNPGKSSTLAIDNQGSLTLKGSTKVGDAAIATDDVNDKIAIKTSTANSSLTVAAGNAVEVGNLWFVKGSGQTITPAIADGTYGSVYITGTSKDIQKSITGGTFDTDVKSLVDTDSSIYVVVDNKDGTYTVKNDAVASITTVAAGKADTEYFNSVRNAIKAVASNGSSVIKLEKNAEETISSTKANNSNNYSFVLDLNGYTLTLNSKSDATSAATGGTIDSTKDIEIKNGTIASTNVTTVLAIKSGAKVTLTDVTVNPDTHAQVTISNAGTLTLAGTTTVNGGKNAAIQNTAATLVVKSVKDKDTDAETTNVTVGDMSVSGANVLNIELGTFGEVDIADGTTITSTTDVAATDNTPAKCNSHIIGGTFGSDVTKLCHTGYAAVKSGDTYEVKSIESVLAQTQVTETAVVGTTDVKANGTEATNVGNSVKADLSAKGVAIVDAETAAAEKEAALNALTSAGKVTINADGTTSVPVTIVRVVDLAVQVNSVDTTNKTVSVSVTPTYKAYAFAGDLPAKQSEYADKGTLVTVDNKGKASNDAQAAAISGNVVVNVTLPASIAGTATQAYVTHTSGKTTSYYTATVKENVATFTTDGFSTFVISLTNPNPIKSAEISGDTAVIAGKTTQLKLNPTPDDAVLEGTIEWKSEDPTIATVDDNGLVTGVAAGKANITAKVDGVEATIEITVQPAVESVTLNKTAVTLQPGKTETLEATIAPEGAVVAGEIEWKSSDEAVATVEDGVITAVANGDATITVTVDGKSATCAVTVETPADDILTNAAAVTLEAGKSQTVKITVTPADSSDKANATSSNTAIATVTNNDDGTITITAVAAGDADIIVKAGDKTLTIPVTVPGDKTDDNATNPPADNNGETTKPDDNQGDTTKPDDNQGDTTKPDDNKGDTTKPDDNKVDDKNEEPTTPVFTDLTQDWYKDAVNWAAKEGITTGATATTFNPNGTCTRAMVVTFLWRAAGSPEPKSTTTSFTDVNANEYYAKAVAWAVENGITTGTSTTTFSPNAACTRAQVVTFLWRAANKPVVSSTTSFTDVAAGSYYADAVNWAVANGITTGMSSTTFQPNTTCTRGMVVTFLYRAQ